jgi:hypothetical protein
MEFGHDVRGCEWSFPPCIVSPTGQVPQRFGGILEEFDMHGIFDEKC